MKTLLAALILACSPAQAATWEALTEKALQEGSVSETNYGFTKALERREGNQVAYFTLDIDPQTGQTKRYSAVIENWAQNPNGKIQVEQKLFWFTPFGELAVTARYEIGFKADKSFEYRKEISYGEEPQAADLALWESLLKNW